MDDLSCIGAYEMRIEALLGLGEYFAMFLNDDAFLKSRRTWSLHR